MCGIFGITGNNDAPGAIHAALDRMAYRGYDSAGIAVPRPDGSGIELRRAAGRVEVLGARLKAAPVEGNCGIGHTRWATHGCPSERNAHPHVAGDVALVHNGIIENHAALRNALADRGVVMASETDSEVVAHLVAERRAAGRAPLDAVRDVVGRLEGSFALAFVFAAAPDTIIAARRGSPLAIGLGDGEMMALGSDAVSIAPLCGWAWYLEDGDLAEIVPGQVRVFDAAGTRVTRVAHDISDAEQAADKGRFAHFMAKEIFEQPDAARHALRAHDTLVHGPAGVKAGTDLAGIDFTDIDRLRLVACGTSYYAALTARPWIERLTGWPVDVEIASEARFRHWSVGASTLGVFVSQSGETADTLAAMTEMQRQGARTAAIINVAESSIERAADAVLEMAAGPEIGVASTKAFTCQLITLAALALGAGRARGVDPDACRALSRALDDLPYAIEDMLGHEAAYKAAAAAMTGARSAFFLGRGAMFPIAMEGALKLKEISYIHAEGFAAGELKHGPIALVDEATPAVVLAPASDALTAKTMANAAEVSARGGRLLVMSDDAGLARDLGAHLPMSKMSSPEQAPFLAAIGCQMLSYHVAAALGRDIDKPRNLAKSVTVE